MLISFWRIPPTATLRLHRWPDEDEYVVHHGAANATHRLSAVAGMFLEYLASGKSDTSGFISLLQELGDDTPEITMANLLEALQRLDIIEPIDAP